MVEILRQHIPPLSVVIKMWLILVHLFFQRGGEGLEHFKAKP